MRNTDAIVRLFAVVISVNPYQTTTGPTGTNADNQATVLRGLLLEYHPNGTLLDALRSAEPGTDRPWRRRALQIADGLDQLHHHRLTHMDLKPANVVISADHDAVLIDISGRAITQEWLSPEMRDIFCPWSEDLGSRVQNDIWAFGKITSQMANACNGAERQLLDDVASRATAELCPRIPLRDAIVRLRV